MICQRYAHLWETMYLSPERHVVSWSLRALGLSEDPKDAQKQPQCFPDVPTVPDVPSDMYHEFLSTDSSNNVSIAFLSWPAPSFVFFTFYCCHRTIAPYGTYIHWGRYFTWHVSSWTCYSFEYWSFIDCSVKHLHKMCLLHGLDVSGCSKARDIKIQLLYHIINGDCFAQQGCHVVWLLRIVLLAFV